MVCHIAVVTRVVKGILVGLVTTGVAVADGSSVELNQRNMSVHSQQSKIITEKEEVFSNETDDSVIGLENSKYKVSTKHGLPTNQPIIVELSINRIVRGDYPVIMGKSGAFLIRGNDLKEIEVKPPYGTAVRNDGVEYFSLSGLGATKTDFDEKKLHLSIELPADRLPIQKYNFQGQMPLNVIYPTDNSAYLNYRVQNSGDDSTGRSNWIVGGDLRVRVGDFLFQNEAAYFRTCEEERTIRYGTSVRHDNRETLQRIIAGDFTASSGNLGNTINMGGISFSRSWTLNPYFVQQPMAELSTSIMSPSEVEIYLDDMRIRSEKVAPGNLSFNNLDYYGGRHDLEMVIRDSFGREQRMVRQYYFSEQNLRQGLHDYSYSAGQIRSGIGTDEEKYSDWAVSGFHRYGLSNEVTIGLRGEADSGVINLGPTSVLRMDRWGVINGSVAGSRSDKKQGWAVSTGYEYRHRNFNLQGHWRYFTSDYEIVGSLTDSDRPKQEIAVASGYGLKGFGNIGISFKQLEQHKGMDRDVSTISYSRAINQRFNIMAAVSHTGGVEQSNYFFLNLSYHPGHSMNMSLRHRQNRQGYSDAMQIGNTTPIGRGLGYRFTAERTVIDDRESVRISPWIQHSSQYGVYTANVQREQQADGETLTGYQVSAAGGIGMVADTVRFSRPISDSFALVDIGDLEGVRIYHSSNELGHSDKNGKLFIPDLNSYQLNRIAIDDRDIPIDYAIDKNEVQVSPPLRSGSVIRFEVNRYRAVTGYIRIKENTTWIPPEYGELSISKEGAITTTPIGRDGEFYLENLQPSHYSAAIEYRGKRCEFELIVPDAGDMIIDVGEINACVVMQ